MPAVWFDSNAVKMTTAEHDLTKFSEHSRMFIFTILNAVINTVIQYLNSLTGIILSIEDVNLFNFETGNLNVNDVIK